MTVSLKPFPAYRDSAIAELGIIPAHWQVKSLSALGSFFKGKGASKQDEVASGVPCVRYGDLYTRHEFFIHRTRAFITSEKTGLYTPIRFGDVLFAGSGETIEDIGRSAVVLIDGEACCGGDVIGLRPNREFVPRFLGYACDSASAKFQKSRMARGFTVVHIYPSELKRLFLAVPTINEQHDIVRYLDYVDRRIRRYIRAKQKLIRLLNEQKQAIIHRAVTRGLDPNVRLKPSGIEGLGEIREHWMVLFNQRVFKEHIRNYEGGSETQLSLSQRDGLIPTHEMKERSLQTSTYENWKIAVPGDLVLNRFKAHLGVFFEASLRGIVSFHYGVFAPRRVLVTKYFELLYHTAPYRTIFAGRSNGMTVGLQNLSNQNFYNVRSVFPPVGEQHAIVGFIAGATKTLDAAIRAARREIGLLNEYRTRLIADVVTGKLDVREAAAALPPEADKEETLEEIEAQAEIGDEAEAADIETPEEVEA